MRKNETGFSIVEGLLIVVVVALIGIGGWLVWRKQHAVPKTTDGLLSAIRDDGKNNFSNATFQLSDGWNAESTATSFNHVPGYDYGVSGVGKSLWVEYLNTNQTKSVKWLKFFHKTIHPAKNMGVIGDRIGTRLKAYGYMTTDNKTYRKGDATCTVLNILAGIAQYQNDPNVPATLLQVTCFDATTLKNAAENMKPFVMTYLQAHPSLKAGDIISGPLDIKSIAGNDSVIAPSATSGYDIAEMLVTNANKKTIALYYAKFAQKGVYDASGWRYVTEANDEFGFQCGAMTADPDARKALYNQVCLSAEGQVRLDTNDRAVQ
jgi:hypothetical protein